MTANRMAPATANGGPTTFLTHPSDDFPSPPQVSLPCPVGWAPLRLATVLVAIGKGEPGVGDFMPNVVATYHRAVRASYEEAAAATTQRVRRSPEWDEKLAESRDDLLGGGRRTLHLEGTLRHEVAGTIFQSAMVTVVDRGRFVDVVQLVGSCSADALEQHLGDLRAILAGTVVDAS